MLHNTFRRFARTAVFVTVACLFSACTPAQLSTFTAMTGIEFDADTAANLVSLPDAPIRMGQTQINADGSTSTVPVVEYVNGLPYSHNQMDPVMDAFRAVAKSRGWTPAQVASWEAAVWDIIFKEAGACWNVRYGARFAFYDGRGCVLSRTGSGAAGFGQLTSAIMHVPCAKVNICSGTQVVASPWNSMVSFVTLLESNGVSPYCYDTFSRRFHRVACNNPGIDVP